jgi:hypothetical protein
VSALSTETNAPVKPEDLDWYKVRLTHHMHNRKVLFRSVSEKRARKFLTNRFPRGSEAYLELPDGSEEHYEHERAGEMGTDAEQWQPFNHEDWIPPDSMVPPGESAWSDKEG